MHHHHHLRTRRSRKATVAAATLLAASNGLLAAAAGGGYMQVVSQNAGVSAQMMFLGAMNTVYMLDKAENNTAQMDGSPTWATAYNTATNTWRPMKVNSNTFCAGGASLGDGRMLVTGGNQAVGKNGDAVEDGTGPYKDYDGGKVLRTLWPGAGAAWSEANGQLDRERWYPTVEPLKDGGVVIIGGMRGGGYVPSKYTNDATYEFFPRKGDGKSRDMPMLSRTMPLSLYPITFLMSSGELFVQANKEAILWNYQSRTEKSLPNAAIPKVYPASAGSVLLPLEPENNYLETVLFCGGISLGSAANWGNEGGPRVSLSDRPASNLCEQIQPLGSKQWEQVDSAPSGRSMGQFIILPDGTLWFGNGVRKGTAGYAADPKNIGRPIGQSYGDDPEMMSYIYNPSAPKGFRWTQAARASEPRLYHSSATLLPDSSILIAGSNPNADVTSAHWGTSYVVERYYPSWHGATRPSNDGLPTNFAYGGNGFTLTFASAADASKAKVKLIRTGFSTHAMNMGQRSITLRSVARGNTLYVAQLPNNPNLFAPGPALAFVVVDGVASMGKMVMAGNGKMGAQPTAADTVLPSASGNVRTASNKKASTSRLAAVSADDASNAANGAATANDNAKAFEQAAVKSAEAEAASLLPKGFVSRHKNHKHLKHPEAALF